MGLIKQKKSPIQDDYIEKYSAEKDLNLTVTLDAKAAYKDADFVGNKRCLTPLNFYKQKNCISLKKVPDTIKFFILIS